MSHFEITQQPSLRFQLGCDTDIGGGKENQDESFVWIRREFNLIVLCVLDGHGREVGKVAAVAAKSSLLQFLEAEYSSLLLNPVDFLVRAHQIGHDSIRQAFRVELEKQGFQVRESDDGYLMKRRSQMDYWSCVHGGTSCSIVALVGNALYISNVGDSTALLCSARPVLHKSLLQHQIDAALSTIYGGIQDQSAPQFRVIHDDENMPSKAVVLTAEHSPESPYEYNRLRRYRHRENDPSQPALFVVYDSSTHDKSLCNPVFESGVQALVPSQRGSYYKNVRKEWASLVSTPKSAKYQDALAFTRSLGDLHLHTYGVTHLPEIQKIDLEPIFQSLAETSSLKDQKDLVDYIESSTICVVVATDGVWDNWIYDDVTRFMFDQSCLQATLAGSDGAQRVMSSFMQRNAYFSKKNFGSQADNATGILLYLSYCNSFCT